MNKSCKNYEIISFKYSATGGENCLYGNSIAREFRRVNLEVFRETTDNSVRTKWDRF